MEESFLGTNFLKQELQDFKVEGEEGERRNDAISSRRTVEKVVQLVGDSRRVRKGRVGRVK